jgi:hypothetical protein
MINLTVFEGIVVNAWKYGSDQFVRLASYRDPGQPLKRIGESRDEPDYVNIRFTNAAQQMPEFQGCCNPANIRNRCKILWRRRAKIRADPWASNWWARKPARSPAGVARLKFWRAHMSFCSTPSPGMSASLTCACR